VNVTVSPFKAIFTSGTTFELSKSDKVVTAVTLALSPHIILMKLLMF